MRKNQTEKCSHEQKVAKVRMKRRTMRDVITGETWAMTPKVHRILSKSLKIDIPETVYFPDLEDDISRPQRKKTSKSEPRRLVRRWYHQVFLQELEDISRLIQ